MLTVTAQTLTGNLTERHVLRTTKAGQMFRRAREARKKREAKEKRLFVINFVKRSTAKTVLFININPRVYTRNFNW